MTSHHIAKGRGQGKTTELIQHVIDWLAENETGTVAVVAAPNMRWASTLTEAFDGLPDVEVIPPVKLETGLMGRPRPRLLAIDNLDLLESRALDRIFMMHQTGEADDLVTTETLT